MHFEPGIPEGTGFLGGLYARHLDGSLIKATSRPAQFSALRKPSLTRSTGLCDAGTIVLSRAQKDEIYLGCDADNKDNKYNVALKMFSFLPY